MKKIYYLNDVPVAKIKNGELFIIDDSILTQNRHQKLTCSDKNDENIKLIHHLHLRLNKQEKERIIQETYYENKQIKTLNDLKFYFSKKRIIIFILIILLLMLL